MDAVQKMYGVNGFVNENPLITSASTSIQQVFGSSPQRLQWFLINLGNETAYWSFDPNPSATNGAILAANGGYYSFSFVEDTIIPTRAIYIATATGTTALYSFEIIAY